MILGNLRARRRYAFNDNRTSRDATAINTYVTIDDNKGDNFFEPR